MRVVTKILWFCLWLPLLNPQIGETAPRAAIIVGIDDYPEESNIPDLQLAARDAQNVSDFLKQRGYQRYTLINDEATRENLKAGIDTFAKNAMQAPFELVIFYFSGRGSRIPDERMPPDEEDGYDECLLLSDAKANEAETYLRDDELLQWLARIQTDVVLIVLDCSFRGHPGDASVKGFGSVTGDALDGVSPVKEGDVASLQNALVLSASEPDKDAIDGVLTPALLTTLETEAADISGDRRLSVSEIQQHLKGLLTGKQKTQIFDPWQLDPVLVVLPPLPTLQVTSNPSGAEVFIRPAERGRIEPPRNRPRGPLPPPDRVGRRRPARTPLQLALKKGRYYVRVQKSGFRRPPPQEIELTEYDTAYTLEPFTLQPIGVHGTVRDSRGNPVDNLSVQFRQNGNIMNQRSIGDDGIFHLSLEQDNWLQLAQEYSITVIGRQVLNTEAKTFVLAGYEDIHLPITVTLDITAPQLMRVDFSASRTAPDPNLLLPGDDVSITIIASDDGLGVESASLALGQSGNNERLHLEPHAVDGVEKSDQVKSYVFRHAIIASPSAIEKWTVVQIELRDKAGNSHLYRANEINIRFTVFPDPVALGQSYFEKEAYTKALTAFGLAEVQTDRGRYMTALAHDALKSTHKAVETFLTITDQRQYLASHPSDLPAAPRSLINKLWGHYLDGLPQNRRNPDHLELLAVTAEALNRHDQAKLYSEYREHLLSRKNRKSR
ncbi:MAG: caspase family protein [Candidatus Poribacteria bacterium]|nr:caspase family protein [Candidatus Poribacteria bacterium]